jgi:hypothetical protein
MSAADHAASRCIGTAPGRTWRMGSWEESHEVSAAAEEGVCAAAPCTWRTACVCAAATVPLHPSLPQDNGLKLSNSWAGHHVLLNPDYRAQVQWRFVNRGGRGRWRAAQRARGRVQAFACLAGGRCVGPWPTRVWKRGCTELHGC